MGKYPKGASLGTCDHLDIWPEWWGDMTWPKKHNLPAHLPTYLPTCLPPIENTIRSDPRDLWLLRYLIRVLRTHDLTQKNLPTYLPTYLHNYSPTYLPCDTRQSSRLVTIETQITILTIENLNSWQSFLPDNQEWQTLCLFQDLRVFFEWTNLTPLLASVATIDFLLVNLVESFKACFGITLLASVNYKPNISYFQCLSKARCPKGRLQKRPF